MLIMTSISSLSFFSHYAFLYTMKSLKALLGKENSPREVRSEGGRNSKYLEKHFPLYPHFCLEEKARFKTLA